MSRQAVAFQIQASRRYVLKTSHQQMHPVKSLTQQLFYIELAEEDDGEQTVDNALTVGDEKSRSRRVRAVTNSCLLTYLDPACDRRR